MFFMFMFIVLGAEIKLVSLDYGRSQALHAVMPACPIFVLPCLWYVSGGRRWLQKPVYAELCAGVAVCV